MQVCASVCSVCSTHDGKCLHVGSLKKVCTGTLRVVRGPAHDSRVVAQGGSSADGDAMEGECALGVSVTDDVRTDNQGPPHTRSPSYNLE